MNTSYTDVGYMTPTERKSILQLIENQKKFEQEQFEKMKS